jgi:hypothetical protein
VAMNDADHCRLNCKSKSTDNDCCCLYVKDEREKNYDLQSCDVVLVAALWIFRALFEW